jgi:hypothetical protein
MSNSDKKIQDKLQQFSAPANPQAWEAMEAMLDKKDRPKLAFWWWTGGVAASAVIAIGLLLSLIAGGNNTPAPVLANNQQTISDNINLNPDNTITSTTKQNISGKTPPTSAISPINKNTVAISTGKTNNGLKNTVYSTTSSEEDLLAATITPAAKNKTPRRSKNNITIHQSHNQNITSSLSSNSLAHNTVPLDEEIAGNPLVASSALSSEASNEAIYIRRIALGPLPTEGFDAELNNNNDTGKSFSKKPKKKLFSYSIGAQTMLLATITDKKLCPLPSHSSGIMQWFGLGKYISFHLGLTAGQTSFATSDSFLSSYSLTTLSIPAGVQLNPFSKGRIAWTINTGISNNFVLQESVRLNNPPPQQAEDITSTPNVNFGNNAAVKTIALEKSVNKYHLSFCAGTGIEVAIRHKISFYSNATFAMPLTPVSSEKQKLVQVGGAAGFRFRLL